MTRSIPRPRLIRSLGVLFLISSAMNIAAAQQNSSVSVGLTSRMSDTEVLELLGNHNLMVSRVYIAASGFSGSHGSGNATTTSAERDLLIERARNETIAFFGKALEGNAYRLQKLTEANAPEQLVQNQELSSNLRALLKLRGQFESVMREAKSGAPLIYAIDVQGASEALESLRQDAAVRVVAIGDDAQPKVQAIQNLRPDDTRTEYVDRETDALTNEEVLTKVIGLMNPSRPPIESGTPGLTSP